MDVLLRSLMQMSMVISLPSFSKHNGYYDECNNECNGSGSRSTNQTRRRSGLEENQDKHSMYANDLNHLTPESKISTLHWLDIGKCEQFFSLNSNQITVSDRIKYRLHGKNIVYLQLFIITLLAVKYYFSVEKPSLWLSIGFIYLSWQKYKTFWFDTHEMSRCYTVFHRSIKYTHTWGLPVTIVWCRITVPKRTYSIKLRK